MMNVRTLAMLAALVPFATGASAQVAQQPTSPFTPEAPLEDRFIASGFLGSTFGDEVEDANLTVSGSMGYLWGQRIGGEFLVGHAPNLTLPGVTDTPITNYMANAIAALPLGFERQWLPYVSGGFGGLTLGAIDDPLFPVERQTSWGGNLGFGVMGFVDQWGIRADVRRYSQLGDAGEGLLDDLAFWRGDVGVAVRW